MPRSWSNGTEASAHTPLPEMQTKVEALEVWVSPLTPPRLCFFFAISFTLSPAASSPPIITHPSNPFSDPATRIASLSKRARASPGVALLAPPFFLSPSAWDGKGKHHEQKLVKKSKRNNWVRCTAQHVASHETRVAIYANHLFAVASQL